MNRLIQRLIRRQPVFIDTACFIYAFEDHPQFGEPTSLLFDAVSEGKIKAYTSIFTVSEVLTKPYEEGKAGLARRYQEIFQFLPHLKLLSPNYETAINVAKIRARYKFTLIDSFQLALAKEAACQTFLTNDKRLKRYNDLKVQLLSEIV